MLPLKVNMVRLDLFGMLIHPVQSPDPTSYSISNFLNPILCV